VQTTLLGLAIAFIIALIAALIGPYFIDWSQFRPQFEAEATQVIGAPVRFAGELQARLLPSPSLRLSSVVVGGANDLGKVRADRLDVEFSLSSLMRGEWRATELSIGGMALDLGLDPRGRIDWPGGGGKFNLGSLAIDRLNLTGRAALHDASSHATLELDDIAFSGDVRALAGSLRGDGHAVISGQLYPFRVSSGQSADGNGTRLHLSVDSSARSPSVDLDGILSFDARAPRFEGAVTLAALGGAPGKGSADPSSVPWRLSAKMKADHTIAKLDQIEANYGTEDVALKLAGSGDIRFGASPLLRATLSARQLDADRFAGKDTRDGTAKESSIKDRLAAEPLQVLPALRTLIAASPELPIPAQLELSAEQIMLGGRGLQNFAASLHTDMKSWAVDRLEVRAPGSTRISLSGNNAANAGLRHFKGPLSVESSDPDTLLMWLQGRSEPIYRSQSPFRLSGEIDVSADRVAIESVKGGIDGGDFEGKIALARETPGNAALDAELKSERLDLDSTSVFLRALLGSQDKWPERMRLSLQVNHAISAGQDLHPLVVKLGYDPKTLSLESLKIGEAGGIMLEGAGAFNRTDVTGKLVLDSSAPSLSRIAGALTPLWPQLSARLNAAGSRPGLAKVKLALALGKEASSGDLANASAAIELESPQFKGSATIAARPEIADLREADVGKLRRSEVSVDAKMSSDQGASLLAVLGLDGVIAAKEGPSQLQGSVSGVWGAPLRLKANLFGADFEVEAQGTANPFAIESKARQGNVALKARNINLAPLFDLKTSDKLAQDIDLSSQVSLGGGKLTFDDIDASLMGSRLRGHLAMTLDDRRKVEGEIGLDALELAPAFALAVGAAGREATEPLGAGFLKGWGGQIAFQALKGVLPDGVELRPISVTIKSDGQSLIFDEIKGGIGGGEATGNIEARQTAGGLALNARFALAGVDGAALRYRKLAMPAGRASLQMTLSGQGRSAQALTGALAGNGTVTLEAARVVGLDPRAFDIAIRAGEAGQALDDAKLRNLVEPALAGGALLVASAQIPFTIRDGRLRVGATALNAEGARAIVSGGYDIPADQADIRATLTAGGAGHANLPEIQIFAAGPPDSLNRTVDVSALSSWLAVRSIERETRRLDAIERGEATSTSLPSPGQPPALPKPKPRVSHPPGAPGTNTNAASAANPTAGTPVASQQVPPLPPPIDVRPAPNAARVPPKPKPPLVLTPPLASSPSAF
jgi:large subunit ribosomal protein L24